MVIASPSMFKYLFIATSYLSVHSVRINNKQ